MSEWLGVLLIEIEDVREEIGLLVSKINFIMDIYLNFMFRCLDGNRKYGLGVWEGS